MKTFFSSSGTAIPSTCFYPCPDRALFPDRQGVSPLTQMLGWKLAEDQGLAVGAAQHLTISGYSTLLIQSLLSKSFRADPVARQ
jgi:hypothetical protein